MKNVLLRAFVLVLTLGGFAATMSAKPPVKTTGPKTDVNFPVCGPGSPNNCGID